MYGFLRNSHEKSLPKVWSRNWHCLVMHKDMTSDGVINTCVLGEVGSPLHTPLRKESLLNRSLAQTEGYFRARRGILLEAYFNSCRICLPISDWKDSSFESNEELRMQDSDPYMRTENMQDLTMFLDERRLWSP